MKCNRRTLLKTLALCVILNASFASLSQPAQEQSGKAEKHTGNDDKPVDLSRVHKPVLWHDPGQISSLNLFYGQGGEDGQPAPPFHFVSEDMHGTNPKFNARDAHGTKWRVKMGDEAQPEVVASRLLWAVGYFVEDDYVLATADVENLHITRGAALAPGGHIEDARFARKPDDQKKIGIWRWKKNPFLGTKEFNGLRVMMAVMNNWDLKDVNNAVFVDRESRDEIFLTGDIGATFGTNGLSWSKDRSKGDVNTFEKSKFIIHKTDAEVDFATPAAASPLLAANVKQYHMRHDLEWIGKGIPIADARWIGSLLKQLSHPQLVDAFRAGHFSQEEIDTFVSVVEGRINELAAL
jgi:hypothetical protein